MTSNTDGRPALSNELIEQFSLHGRTAVITGAAGGIDVVVERERTGVAVEAEVQGAESVLGDIGDGTGEQH